LIIYFTNRFIFKNFEDTCRWEVTQLRSTGPRTALASITDANANMMPPAHSVVQVKNANSCWMADQRSQRFAQAKTKPPGMQN